MNTDPRNLDLRIRLVDCRSLANNSWRQAVGLNMFTIDGAAWLSW